VISGGPQAIQWAMVNSKKMGARMAVELNVSGAFHSPLMASARENLAEMINSLDISNTKYPIYTNVDAQPVTRNQDIKDSLIRQMENPVRWTDSILRMKNDGIKSFFEIGPGKVLQGLNKRIDKSIKLQSIESVIQMEQINV